MYLKSSWSPQVCYFGPKQKELNTTCVNQEIQPFRVGAEVLTWLICEIPTLFSTMALHEQPIQPSCSTQRVTQPLQNMRHKNNSHLWYQFGHHLEKWWGIAPPGNTTPGAAHT